MIKRCFSYFIELENFKKKQFIIFLGGWFNDFILVGGGAQPTCPLPEKFLFNFHWTKLLVSRVKKFVRKK